MKHNIFEDNSSSMNLQINPADITEQVDFIEEILEKEPPNKSIQFNVEWYKHFSAIKSLTIDDYCEKCDKTSSFVSKDAHTSFETFYHSYDMPHIDDYRNQTERTPICIKINLQCAKCREAHFISLLFKGDNIVKIGQYPSFAGKEKHELERYKNIIAKYYIELIRSVNAYSQHMGIAAFVYLRRIYEHIVEKEYAELPDSTKKSNASFDDKMKAVDKKIHIIPNELDSQKSKIYSILSKGIHEYEEDECYELYPMMKVIIIMMLDRYLSEKERKKQLKDITETLKSK